MAEIAVFQDQQSSGVAGDTVTTTMADMTLNTVIPMGSGITGASLTSNKFTLPIGDYIVNVFDPIFVVNQSYTTKYYIRDNSNNVLDSATGYGPSITGYTVAKITLTFSLSVETELKLSCRNPVFGTPSRPATSDGVEYYQKIIIQKL